MRKDTIERLERIVNAPPRNETEALTMLTIPQRNEEIFKLCVEHFAGQPAAELTRLAEAVDALRPNKAAKEEC